MRNENTKKTVKAIRAICGDLERVAKKALIFDTSIQAMQQSDLFTKFDYELQFMEIMVVLENASEKVKEALKEYQVDED